MLTIVIPMAGAGNRFIEAGYKDPKPLIPLHGTPMIRLVIENVRPARPCRFIFICQRAHAEKYGLVEKLNAWASGCTILQLDGLTEGAACTVLTARALIDNGAPLMIANSDQYIDADINTYLAEMDRQNMDGFIMTHTAHDPRWSFVGFDDERRVARVVEKQAISDEATVGVYNFRHGRDFVAAAEAMIAADLRVGAEFYVAPVYNQLIARKVRIGVYNIGTEGRGMHGLGTPEDFAAFLKLPLSHQAVRKMR
jgi:dTDP-glucose pyrophosphorylase